MWLDANKLTQISDFTKSCREEFPIEYRFVVNAYKPIVPNWLVDYFVQRRRIGVFQERPSYQAFLVVFW